MWARLKTLPYKSLVTLSSGKNLTPNSKADGIHCSGCSSQTLDLCSLSVFFYLTLRLSLGFFFSEKPQLSDHLSLAKGISEYSQRNLCVTPLRDVQSLDHVGTVIQAFCVSWLSDKLPSGLLDLKHNKLSTSTCGIRPSNFPNAGVFSSRTFWSWRGCHSPLCRQFHVYPRLKK